MSLKRVSRGAAFGDYDDDGDIDVLVANVAAEPTLMRNDGASGHWVRLRLEGRDSNRAGIGTRVEVTSGGQVQTDEVRSGPATSRRATCNCTLGWERPPALSAWSSIGRAAGSRNTQI